MSIENPTSYGTDEKEEKGSTIVAKSGFKPKPEDHSHDGVDDKYLGEYEKTAFKEMKKDMCQRMTEATSADEIEKLNNSLIKTQEAVAKDVRHAKKLSWKERKQYNIYKTKDAEKAAFIKNGVPNTVIEEAAQENLDKATTELDEVGSRIADLQTEKNKQALNQDSDGIGKSAEQLKPLEQQQADLEKSQWKADWEIDEKNKIKEDIANTEKSRTLADAEFLKQGAEYDKETGERLEFTNEQIEAARLEMSRNLEEQMKAKKSGSLSPEEIAKIGKERKLLEAELIKHGAKYEIGKNGEKQLVLTPEQISQANNEMKKALEGIAKESPDKKVEGNQSKVETAKNKVEDITNTASKKETKGEESDNKAVESKAGKATKWELPGWVKTLRDGIAGVFLILFASLFGFMEKQLGKKKGK